jgi:DNA-binding NarL/FixJ family response regulator
MSLRILVVDDHAVVRRGVRSLLESHDGWERYAERRRPAATRSKGTGASGPMSS